MFDLRPQAEWESGPKMEAPRAKPTQALTYFEGENKLKGTGRSPIAHVLLVVKNVTVVMLRTFMS